MDSPETDAPAPRWFQRALPMTALAVALVALAALVVPAFRDQVELSTSRRPQPYAELYFAHSTDRNGQAVCTTKAGQALVRFAIGSHLEKRQSVAYRVALVPGSRGATREVKAGAARVTPGTALEVSKSFARPRGDYTVSVRLPALGQQLRAHCPGRRS